MSVRLEAECLLKLKNGLHTSCKTSLISHVKRHIYDVHNVTYTRPCTSYMRDFRLIYIANNCDLPKFFPLLFRMVLSLHLHARHDKEKVRQTVDKMQDVFIHGVLTMERP